METLTMGCLVILCLMSLESAKWLNVLGPWEGEQHFNSNNTINQSTLWTTLFHGGNGRAWTATTPKHWAAFSAGESLPKVYGFISPGLKNTLHRNSEAKHCVTQEDKVRKWFLFMQASEYLAKRSNFIYLPAIPSNWHADIVCPFPSLMELPPGKHTMAVSTQHNTLQKNQQNFGEMKEKQTLKNQSVGAEEERNYPDLVDYFSFDDASKVELKESHWCLDWTMRNIYGTQLSSIVLSVLGISLEQFL